MPKEIIIWKTNLIKGERLFISSLKPIKKTHKVYNKEKIITLFPKISSQPINENNNVEVINPRNIARPPILTILLLLFFLKSGFSVMSKFKPNLFTGFTNKDVSKYVTNKIVNVFAIYHNQRNSLENLNKAAC